MGRSLGELNAGKSSTARRRVSFCISSASPAATAPTQSSLRWPFCPRNPRGCRSGVSNSPRFPPRSRNQSQLPGPWGNRVGVSDHVPLEVTSTLPWPRKILPACDVIRARSVRLSASNRLQVNHRGSTRPTFLVVRWFSSNDSKKRASVAS